MPRLLLGSLRVRRRSGCIADRSSGGRANPVGVCILWIEKDRLVQILDRQRSFVQLKLGEAAGVPCQSKIRGDS